MQHAGQATSSFPPSGGNVMPPASADPGFVINLCASTTPMALPRHEHPELKRFTFFISRRREEGRERFRLHMGYFQTQEDAEQLLELVREIYPAAWAGVAPGQRLRAAAAVAASAAPSAAPSAAVTAAPAAGAPVPPASPAPLAAVVPPTLPTLPTLRPPVAEAAASPPPRAAAPLAAPAAPAVELARAPDPAPATAPAEPALSAAAQSLHSVRAAISSLEPAVSEAPVAEAPKARPAPPVVSPTVVMPELRAVPVARPAAPSSSPKPANPISDSQVLRVLEAPVTTPEPRSETAAYAVQLQWSVQPIDMNGVPQLAIFSAYTLYGAAGNRDGRRWYGLRLGFFTDAVSAKQVANYVRSEFASVSIVPVSARERERALAAAPRAPLADVAGVAPKKAAVNVASSGEFRLLDEKSAAARPAEVQDGARPSRGAPGKRARLRAPPPAAEGAAAPKRRAPLSLEETLEILGASELKLQDGRDDPLNDSGIRHLRAEAMKGRRASRFSKLMDRLSERFGGG